MTLTAAQRADAFAERARAVGLLAQRSTSSSGIERLNLRRDTSAYEGSLLAAFDSETLVLAYWSTGGTGRSRFRGGHHYDRYLKGGGRKIRTLRDLEHALFMATPAENRRI